MENVKKWAKCAAIRALKTVAQAAIAMVGTAVIMSQVDWTQVASAALLAGILSLLTSVAGIPEAGEGKSPLAMGDGDAES